ncbi:MAG: site-specific DNA-methyltransferase, partial [Tissierellia bacterium]|nr:site-specific DNA-methyltransferase [Tissierellia bacterium]
KKYIGMLQRLYEELRISNKRVCLWVKNGMGLTPNIAFNKCYEPCLYGIKGKPYLSNIKNLNEILNKEVDPGNRTLEDIIDIFDIWLAKRDVTTEYEHPTQKPLSLHEEPLKRCTKVGDVVLDMCAGSGSTLLACEQLNRVCYSIEMSPIFCQLIINRFQKFYGTDAVKIN